VEAESHAGVLFDALADKRFGQNLLTTIARHRRYRGGSGQVYARTTPGFHRLRDLPRTQLDPVLLKGEQNNTSVAFGDALVLKFMRWVEDGINPEVEVPQVLADKTSFKGIAPLAGTLSYQDNNGATATWATLS